MVKREAILDDFPRELANAMQGIAFWMGHQHARYGGYRLSEGTIVDELASLIGASYGLFGRFRFTREKAVHDATSADSPPGPGRHPAFDLAITERLGDGSDALRFCIEVKRAGANHDGDLDRLWGARREAGGSWRGLLFYVGEPHNEFLTADLRATTETRYSKGLAAPYRVRRVCRAVSAVEADTGAGHWVCALEVLDSPQMRPT